MSGIIVDEPYTINEKYGVKYYYITVDSPDYNSPIHHWSGQCRLFRKKKIERLRKEAIEYGRNHLKADKIEYTKVKP